MRLFFPLFHYDGEYTGKKFNVQPISPVWDKLNLAKMYYPFYASLILICCSIVQEICCYVFQFSLGSL